jgi:hypothetical protein
MEKETTKSEFDRHTRHYLAKSFIVLDQLEAMLRYPNEHGEPLELVEKLRTWNLQALNCASGEMHTIPHSK